MPLYYKHKEKYDAKIGIGQISARDMASICKILNDLQRTDVLEKKDGLWRISVQSTTWKPSDGVEYPDGTLYTSGFGETEYQYLKCPMDGSQPTYTENRPDQGAEDWEDAHFFDLYIHVGRIYPRST